MISAPTDARLRPFLQETVAERRGERIAPQWSWIKVRLSAASLTEAGIGGSPSLSA